MGKCSYKSIFVLLSLLVCYPILAKEKVDVQTIALGVIKLQTGKTDQFTPYTLLAEKPKLDAMSKLPSSSLPFPLDNIKIEITPRGCSVEVPLAENEQLYGFGLQIETFKQRGLKKKPIVNDNPLNGLGYSHAPQTFYVSTNGYGILINTSRNATFLCGTNSKLTQSNKTTDKKDIAQTTEELYKNEDTGEKVYIDIPNAEGVEIFVFYGPDMKSVVQRYNLLSGGGCLPPMWGLGFKYRVKGDSTQDTVNGFADYFRSKNIPCDILGLEPGWQTAAYSCSYIWSKDRFPNHAQMLNQLKDKNYKVNLWEHAYIHPSSPIRKPMEKYAGDFLVWNGLVPDFTQSEARKIFGDYHETLIAEGLSGFKLDECDNSNIARADANWGFPDMTKFPSGIDGEQMHQVFGALYLKTMNDVFVRRNTRTYQDYRASSMFVSSIPATLYSDTYDHKEYIQMVGNAAFGGLLWTPEVREAVSERDLFHRLQTVMMSSQALVNAWYLKNAPWLQFDKEKNNNGEFLSNANELESYARDLINIRMQLIPYLYSAFAEYQNEGIPPFRPLIMDYPKDEKVQSISDQFMMGSNIMAAPLYDTGKDTRKVYFPAGTWYNFNTNEKYEGGKEYEIKTAFNQMPMYVKEGTILPLAAPVQAVTKETVFELTCKVYGTASTDFILFEDDGVSYNYQKGDYNKVILRVVKDKVELKRTGNYKQKRYIFKDQVFVK